MTRLGFTGELVDPNTGLVYLRARHYHPVLGRFLQRDTFAGFVARGQSLHRYAYTENNPVNLTDPSGHCPWCVAAGAGAVIGAGTEYGSQVYQNYQSGVRGGAMFTQNLNWRRIGMGAVGGAVGGLAGLGLGSVLGGVGGRLGSGMAGRMAMGFVEGGLSDVASRIAMNTVMSCAWNDGLWSAFIGGGLGGGVGAVIGAAWRGLKNLSLNTRELILLNDVYDAMDALMPPEITIFTTEMTDMFMKSPEWLEWQRRLIPKYNTPEDILALPRTVLSGHGGWYEADGYITIPEGTYLITYSPLGGTISDAMGNLIELDQVHDELYRQIFSPGDRVPNYTLFRPDKLNIMGNPFTTEEPIKLNDLLSPNDGQVHWAACTVFCKKK